MPRKGIWRLLSALLVAWMLEQTCAFSAENVGPTSPAPIQDVVLHKQLGHKKEVLVGTILDGQGRPLGEREIKLFRGDVLLTATRSTKDGYFAFSDVSPGAYRVVAENSETQCRVWSTTNAPPGAQPGLVAVEGDQLVRGQIFPRGQGRLARALRNPWVIGGIVAVAVAVPVAIALADDDDKAPASP